MVVPVSRTKGADLMRSANRVSWRRFAALAFLSTILPLAVNPHPLHADLFFFKDGFVIEGKVRREMTLEFDQVGRDAYYMPKGFFFLDDGPRRIFFSPAQIRYISEKDPPPDDRINCPNPHPYQVNPKKFPGLADVVSAPEWDEKWSRRYQFLSSQGQVVNVPQHIGKLTPYWAQVDSTGKYFWSCAYLTRELGPATVQSLLASHADFQEKKNQPSEKRASMRLRKADFFAQAGFLDLADKELDRLVSDFPDQKERIDAARKALVKLRSGERIEDIKRRRLAGQHRRVRKLLDDFPTKDVPKEHLAKVEELKHEYKEAEQLLQETARLLEKARKEAVGADNNKNILCDAAGIIHDELDIENVGRLDAFLGQARQAERLQKAGSPSEASAEQLLSLAVSGWLLGSASAEMSVETAKRLWNGRDMVLSYLRTDDPNKRAQMLQQHVAGSRTESASLDELVQIIRTLPPIAAEKPLPEGAVQYKTAGTTYFVQLPPEYRPSRSYPVLIVLHQAGQKASDMLKRWGDSAAANGYILLAPEWQGGLNNRYTYSEAEHETLLKALRDLRRRFHVDDDRVFLFGLGDGGAMALDVGLGHPDLFAGVLPMGAGPQFHAELCWRNAQKLPFYIVYGSQGPDHEKMRELFNNWVILRPFDSLWIDYKGRGVEWLAGEVPNMFDWMRHKKREFPLRKLGSDGGGGAFGNEYCTLRPCDNHFYWLSSDDIRNTKDLSNWQQRLRWPPASLSASIDTDNKIGNVIQVKTTGLGQVTIWLGRNSKGEDMIDFDKPVTVRHGFNNVITSRKVSPSLEVLLEDLYQRGDRQQLFLAKISFKFGARARR
jgi:predicted esterase